MQPTRTLVAGAAALWLFCCSKSENGASPAASTTNEPQIEIQVTERGFSPSEVTFQMGTPASVVFVRKTDDTCAKQVVFPELKLTKDLPLNTPVKVDLPTRDPGRLTFQCGMGMFKSVVIIR